MSQTTRFFLGFSVPSSLRLAHIELSENLGDDFKIPDTTDWCTTHIPITPPFQLTESQYLSMDQLLEGLNYSTRPLSVSFDNPVLVEGDTPSIILPARFGENVENVRKTIIAGLLEHEILGALNSDGVLSGAPLVRWDKKPTREMQDTVLDVVRNWPGLVEEITVDNILLFEENVEGGRWKERVHWEFTQI